MSVGQRIDEHELRVQVLHLLAVGDCMMRSLALEAFNYFTILAGVKNEFAAVVMASL